MKLYSMPEAAKYLSVSVRSMQRWQSQGVIKPHGRTPGGYARYTKDQLDKLINAKKEVKANDHSITSVEELLS